MECRSCPPTTSAIPPRRRWCRRSGGMRRRPSTRARNGRDEQAPGGEPLTSASSASASSAGWPSSPRLSSPSLPPDLTGEEGERMQGGHIVPPLHPPSLFQNRGASRPYSAVFSLFSRQVGGEAGRRGPG